MIDSTLVRGSGGLNHDVIGIGTSEALLGRWQHIFLVAAIARGHVLLM